jgi:hypothetical protein
MGRGFCLYSRFAVPCFKGEFSQFLVIAQVLVNPRSVFWFGVYRYLLYALSGDDELKACVGEDDSYIAFAGATTILGNNAWGNFGDTRNGLKCSHDERGGFGESGMSTAANAFHRCSIYQIDSRCVFGHARYWFVIVQLNGGCVKKILLVVCFFLVSCKTEVVPKRVLITPSIYKQAVFLCSNEKGLLWIGINPENTAELEVLCHSENVFKIKLAN